MKHIIETTLLEALLNAILNAIHPNVPVSQINQLIEKVKKSVIPFEEPKQDLEEASE